MFSHYDKTVRGLVTFWTQQRCSSAYPTVRALRAMAASFFFWSSMRYATVFSYTSVKVEGVKRTLGNCNQATYATSVPSIWCYCLCICVHLVHQSWRSATLGAIKNSTEIVDMKGLGDDHRCVALHWVARLCGAFPSILRSCKGETQHFALPSHVMATVMPQNQWFPPKQRTILARQLGVLPWDSSID